MTHFIRLALIVIPLGLIVSGCARHQRIQTSSRPPPRQSVRSGPVPATTVVDRRSSNSDETHTGDTSESSKTDSQHDITLDQIREHVNDKTAVLIDARGPEQFANGHVRGALNLPAGQIEAFMPQIWHNVTTDQMIIIYCSGPSCGSGDTVYEFLAAQGFTNMRVYRPGWSVLASAKNLR